MRHCHWNLACLSKVTICFSSGSTLALSNGDFDLHPQEDSIVGKVLHLDYIQSFEYGILDRVKIGHGLLGTVSFCISSSIG